jgi:selenocysteine-specific elongation factor
MLEQTSQINITLGTAGHIDHGKTSLIKLLTGCETDRLKEEKERGMSIELGFAPCRLGELEVGIVDVPGHEHFIKTMVAGATGIDGVLFVVAADDSIMPQTREHLDILTLLGVRHGLVVLTKIDLVTPERIESVQDQLKQFLYGTFLQDAPICPMSNITGDGFDGFYTALTAMIGTIEPKSVKGVFRLPVERTFSVKGFGTVVSGIPASGSAKIGDELELLPAGVKSRIKTIQVYGRDAEAVKSGQCAALNLPKLDHKIVERGNVLAEPGYFRPARWILCTLKILNDEGARLKNGTQLKFHTGTIEVTATAYLLESNTAGASQETFVQIRTDQPVIAAPTDRYIIRGLSPMRTIGGGMVMQAMEHKIKRTQENLVQNLHRQAQAIVNNESFVTYCLEHTPDCAAKIKDITGVVKLRPSQVADILKQLIADKRLCELPGELFVDAGVLEKISTLLVRQVEQFHQEEPQSPGIEKESLLRQSSLKKEVFDGVFNGLLQANTLILRKERIALPSHSEQFDSKQQALLEKVEAAFKKDLFAPPSTDDAALQIGHSVQAVHRTIQLLTEQQRLVRVEQNLFFHTEAIVQAQQRIVEHIQGQGRLESVEFKYIIDTTRKYALPLLDYMDKIGVTRRVGNTRYLKQDILALKNRKGN